MRTMLEYPQYGTSMHWPYCVNGSCSGCLPPLDVEIKPCAPPLGIHYGDCEHREVKHD